MAEKEFSSKSHRLQSLRALYCTVSTEVILNIRIKTGKPSRNVRIPTINISSLKANVNLHFSPCSHQANICSLSKTTLFFPKPYYYYAVLESSLVHFVRVFLLLKVAHTRLPSWPQMTAPEMGFYLRLQSTRWSGSKVYV